MIDFNEIRLGRIVQDPATDIPELLQYFMSRIQFVPATRFAIGWRGMNPSERFQNSWTFKIGDVKGIYGLYFDHTSQTNDWVSGAFGIAYFPHPDEKLIERFSLPAVYQTQQPDYFEKIREFMAHPEMASLFNVGHISLAINHSETALILSLKSLSRHQMVALDGVPFPQKNSQEYFVEPGRIDQNLPSFVIAYGLFKVLAATVTFNLQGPPEFLFRDKRRGHYFTYDDDSHCEVVPATGINDIELQLGYGKANFELQTNISANKTGTPVQSLLWKSGEPYPEFSKKALWWVAHQIDDLKSYDRHMMSIDDRPQLLVISGFLGSGKTSLLQHFLEYQVQRDRFVAVLQNEFGEVGLDGKLLDQSYSVTELNEGTVCCTLAGELRPAISNIIKRFQPDMIVLETSGATNPIGLRDDFLPLSEMVRFDSITTVVDASNYQAVDTYEVAADQLIAADLIVLNKTDLVEEQRLEQITQDIHLRNLHAAVYPTTQGYINPGIIYDFSITNSETSETKNSLLDDDSTKSTASHRHSHDGISSVKINFDHAVDMDSLVQALETLPSSVFRLKGIVDLGSGQAVLVQYVCGHYDVSNFLNPNVSDRFLIIIGNNLGSTTRKLESLDYQSTNGVCV